MISPWKEAKWPCVTWPHWWVPTNAARDDKTVALNLYTSQETKMVIVQIAHGLITELPNVNI